MTIAAAGLGRPVTNLGPLDAIPQGEGRVFKFGGLSIAVFHTRDGNVSATEASCPHREGPLADGVIGGQKVICPLHGFIFDLSSGHPVGNNCRQLKTYPAAINEEGHILVGTDLV